MRRAIKGAFRQIRLLRALKASASFGLKNLTIDRFSIIPNNQFIITINNIAQKLQICKAYAHLANSR